MSIVLVCNLKGWDSMFQMRNRGSYNLEINVLTIHKVELNQPNYGASIIHHHCHSPNRLKLSVFLVLVNETLQHRGYLGLVPHADHLL